MRSMSIGVEPIAVTSLYPTPQTVSEGSFAQSLQEAVDAGSVTPVTEQQVQTDIPAESIPQQPVQDEAPQEVPQEAVPDGTQFTPQDTAQSTTQEPTQEQTQTQPAAQPTEQFAAQPAEQSAAQSAEQPTVQPTAEPQPQTVPQLQSEKAEQSEQFVQAPMQLAGIAEPDPELMKELADLLDRNEEMLTAPQRLRKTLENMIVQALSELSDPEEQEEEFTEMVLDFLMEFIDRKFGGETEETSIFADNAEKNDDDNIQDVLLQAVVQMLDQIRSENARSETPQTTEDGDAVEAIPSTNMAKEYVSTTANRMLSEETKQMVELESFTEAPQTAAEPQTEQQAQEQPESTEISDEIPEGIPAAEAKKPNLTFDRAARRAAEAIYTEITRPYPIRQPVVRPVEKTLSQPVVQPVEETQPQEQLYRQITVQPVQQAPVLPTEQPQTQPVRTDRSREAAMVHMVQPAEELEELTRAVKGGESIRSEQPQLNLSSEQQPEQTKPTVTVEAAGEAVPFEAAIASTVPQITLTQGLADSGSGAEQIVTQIVSEIFNQLPENGGTTTFVMTLNPESLGKVTVKLVEEAGKISVSVTAHEKRTAEILSQRFDTLQTAMKENGTQLEKYQVVYAPEKDEGAAHQNFDGSSKNPYVKQEDEESDGDGEFAEFLQQAV